MGVLGGASFPRPLAVEGMMVIEQSLALGVEYSALPRLDVMSVHTSYWALAGDLRFFFMRGPFYFGVRAGVQHLGANASATVARVGTFVEAVTVDTVFANPRLGLLYTWSPGLSLGFEVGVQVPLTSKIASTQLMPQQVTSLASTLGRSVLPTVDLLRVGLLL